MRDVLTQIFSHFQLLPLRFFDRTPIGRLMARNTNDVDAVPLGTTLSLLIYPSVSL